MLPKVVIYDILMISKKENRRTMLWVRLLSAIGREFGSGGHIIAKGLAEHYNIPLYNKELYHA